MEFKQIEGTEYIKTYWEGKENKLIRLWVYVLRGLDMVNSFKYLVAGLMAGYVILKLTNPLWMLIIGVASIPPLILLGKWQLKKVSKVSEWVSTEHGTVLKYSNYNLQVRILETLQEIEKKLNNK